MTAPEPTREIFHNLPTWMQIVFYLVSAIASGIFLYGFYRRYRKYRRGRPEPRFDQLGARVLRALRKIATNETVRKGEPFGGLAHSFILWGFVVLFIGTVIVAIDHDIMRFFDVVILKGPFYLGFSAVLDFAGLIFIAGIVMMMIRRAALKPPQLDYTRADTHDGRYDRRGFATDDMIFVWLLLAIAVTGYLIEGFRIAQTMPSFERWSFVGWGLASMVQGWSANSLIQAHVWLWWIHAVVVMVFIGYIPFSKMMHIFTDMANLVFVDEDAGKKLPAPPKHTDEEGSPSKRVGYSQITDFTWKELLDFDACTKCGRCHVACPARAAGTTLSPRDLILDLRTYANHSMGTKELFEQRFESGSKWPSSGGPADVAVDVVRPETLFSCTTCRACVEACPVGIEHLTSIVQMRRHLVDQGKFDDNLQGALMNLGDYGNSFGESPKKRAKWTKGLSFKIKDARKKPVEYLWFVGDYASYDARVQANSRRFAEILQLAQVDFGILYDGERNSGNDVRRVGEEGLYEMLEEENLGALEQAEYQKLLTTDPHTLNAFRNEYAPLEGKSPMEHYTALLVTLIREGRLTLKKPLSYKVTYHDPCYLARYNGETQAPRDLIEALGLELREMPRCGTNTFCCGAGGGRIWMDTSNEQKRTSEQRIEEAMSVEGVTHFVTACPKDYAMYTDAAKSVAPGGEIVVRDVIELLSEALEIE